MKELSQSHDVLVFDNRAVGQTKDNKFSDLTIESMAGDTAALAKKLSLKNPHIIGQSMGGAIAQVVAAKHSNYIDRVCIMNAPIKWQSYVLCGLKALHLSYKEGATFENLFQANLAWVFSGTFIGNKAKVEALKHDLQNISHTQSIKDQARQFAALEKYNGASYLKLINSPTLVI